MLIIPAIDIRDGQCVRLIQGDYGRQLTYDPSPATMAQSFADAGARLVHVVDLDGAKLGEPQNWETIAAVAKVAPIEVGGGVRSIATARRLLELGVQRVVVGSKLVMDRDLASAFFQELGDRVVAGIDARDGRVATHGWTQASTVRAVDLAVDVASLGARRIILTDIATDGMLTGPNLSLLTEVQNACELPIIQSGGIGSLADLEACQSVSPEGVIVGRALYEGRFSLQEALSIA